MSSVDLPAGVPDDSLPPPLPPARRDPAPGRLRRWLVDYNPFFLLSALCMLAGSLALTNSLSWSPVRLERILVLAVTINLYELLLVALGLFLIVRRGARRDGAILLIVEAFFLVDVAFLNAELFAIDRRVGLVANVALLAVALAKLAVILRVLRVDLRSPAVAVVGLELVALYALPGVLKFVATAHGGVLPPMAMLGVWWALAALGAATYVTVRRGDPGTAARPPLLQWFVPLVLALGGVSLLAHAGTSQWVYDLRYWGADLAPMLALAAFALCLHRDQKPTGVLFAVASLFAASSYDRRLTFALLGDRVTPVHLTACAVYVLLAWTLARAMFGRLLATGVACALVGLFGPSVATIRALLADAGGSAMALLDRVRPRTQTHWGVVGVALSFVFLAVGAAISLRRPEPRDGDGVAVR